MKFRIHPTFWLALLVLLCVVSADIFAQLQQSGGSGSSVSINAALPAGSNLIGKVGIDQTTPGTTNRVDVGNIPHVIVDTAPSTVITAANLDVALSTRLKPADTLAGVTTVAAVTAITNALPTGANVIGTVNVIPKTSCGNTLATGSALQAVPTSATLLTSAATACVTAAIFNNTTSGALTVTLTDNTGTPVNSLLTFSIPAFSSLVQPLYGSSFNLGVKWMASGAGVTGSVVAYQ